MKHLYNYLISFQYGHADFLSELVADACGKIVVPYK